MFRFEPGESDPNLTPHFVIEIKRKQSQRDSDAFLGVTERQSVNNHCNRDSIEVPGAERFYSHIVNLGVNSSLSTRLLTNTIVQYNNTREIKGINLRLNYIYRPGDDLFLVDRDTRNWLNPEFRDRAFLVKFTRSFDF